ncbi:MAG TPA: Ig-like domain-containing protein [Gemmatimonadales bacterium]|nr:Ig-like domain-containing protein [Gemmatimonadales bacterium]
MARLDTPLTLTLVIGIILSGCGGGDGDGGTPPATTTIAKASSNSGDAQTGTVAQPLSILLQVVVTEGGAPKAGATVTWSTTAPGGSLQPTAPITDAAGAASATWTLGTVSGSQTAQAALSGASGSPVTFTATAAPGAAVELEKVSGDDQRGPVGTQLPAPLIAKVSDQFGNGVPGVVVTWEASEGTVSAPEVPTDAAGASAVTVTLPQTVGPIRITAAADVPTGSPQAYTAEATETSNTAEVSVVNNSFNPSTITVAAGTTVTWTWAPTARDHNVTPDGSEPARSGDLIDGPAIYSYQFNTPGTYRYYCELHGSPGGVGMAGTVTVQ